MEETTFELLKAIIPSIITATVAIIALITSAYSSKKATKTAYNNNIDNMRFTQKERISDQVIEKASDFITKADPNHLNTVINGITPKEITNTEFTDIQTKLLSITDEIQTLSTVLKMLLNSIVEPETQNLVYKIYEEMDSIHSQVQEMIMQLIKIYLALTPNGNIENKTVMPEKYKLENSFSESYSDLYKDFAIDMMNLVRILKMNSIPHPND